MQLPGAILGAALQVKLFIVTLHFVETKSSFVEHAFIFRFDWLVNGCNDFKALLSSNDTFFGMQYTDSFTTWPNFYRFVPIF